MYARVYAYVYVCLVPFHFGRVEDPDGTDVYDVSALIEETSQFHLDVSPR